MRTTSLVNALVFISVTALLAGCGSSNADNFTLYGNGTDTAITAASAASAAGGSGRLIAGVDAAVLKVKPFEFWVSESVLCTDPIKVIDFGASDYVDVVPGPELGTGSVPDGTYPCVIVVSTDLNKYEPAENTGTHCVAGTEYTHDVCLDAMSSELPDGTTTDCATDQIDRIAVYFSTAVSSSGGDSFNPPDAETDSTTGLPLLGPMVVAGQTSGTFYVDSTNRITDTGVFCDLGPGAVGFLQ